MKRKILILFCAVVLVFSMGVTAFASTTKFPVLPVEGEIIVNSHPTYGTFAYVGTNIEETTYGGDPAYTAADGKEYKYNETTGSWEGGTSSTMFRPSGIYVYDSTGRFGITNSIEFDGPISFDDFTAYYDGLRGQITVGNVVGVLVVGVGAVVGLVFMYWGIRKGVKALMSAFRKGKISL